MPQHPSLLSQEGLDASPAGMPPLSQEKLDASLADVTSRVNKVPKEARRKKARDGKENEGAKKGPNSKLILPLYQQPSNDEFKWNNNPSWSLTM